MSALRRCVCPPCYLRASSAEACSCVWKALTSSSPAVDYDLCTPCASDPAVRQTHDARHPLFPIKSPYDRAPYDAARRHTLDKLETRPRLASRSSVEHLDVTCQGCAQTPLLGVRHRCAVCEGERALRFAPLRRVVLYECQRG